MVLRTLRRFTACVAAVAAMAFLPSVSRADTQILVEEIDASGAGIAGTRQIFGGTTSVVGLSLTNFTNVSINANPNSGAISSLTTTVNATPISSGFNPAIGLRVVVTSDGFSTPNVGGTATVTNNASASSAIGGGQNQLTSNTQLLNNPLSPAAASTDPATGAALSALTGVATDVRPNGGVSQETTASVTDFPATFAIQQTITARAINVGPGGVQSGSTLGGSASSTVVTTAVPAPAGAVLALIGLPLLGLRRALRKNKA